MPIAHRVRRNLDAGLAHKLAVAMLCHPSGTGEMRPVNPVGALGLPYRIDSKQDRDGLAPVCALRFCVKQAHVKLHVSTVVTGQRWALRRLIQKWLRCQFEPRRSNGVPCNCSLTLRSLRGDARGAQVVLLAISPSPRGVALSSLGRATDLRADKHHSFALVGRQEDDAVGL